MRHDAITVGLATVQALSFVSLPLGMVGVVGWLYHIIAAML